MSSAFLVSDIHIMSPDSARAHAFLSFLRSLSHGNGASHLILLGDIFDLWVADHAYFVDAYGEIVDEIGRLQEEGVEVHYFEGNHDLHLRYYWSGQLGVTVHSGPACLTLGGKRVRLEHGDQMDPDDKGYIFLRWFLRTPPVRWLIRHLPGGLIARIGDRASATSRDYTSNTKSIEPDEAIAKIRRHAEKVHGESAFDLIVSGHVHVRDDWQGDGFRSVNLGSWFDGPCYFQIDQSGERFVDIDVSADAPVAAGSTP